MDEGSCGNIRYLPILRCRLTGSLMVPDGGGIRGYGSLLMLSELMSKIAECEKELDRTDVINGEPVANGRSLSESSFSPCEYPPIEVNGKIVARNPDSLDDDQLYLPCHYFTFIGGTSTGGYVVLAKIVQTQ